MFGTTGNWWWVCIAHLLGHCQKVTFCQFSNHAAVAARPILWTSKQKLSSISLELREVFVLCFSDILCCRSDSCTRGGCCNKFRFDAFINVSKTRNHVAVTGGSKSRPQASSKSNSSWMSFLASRCQNRQTRITACLHAYMLHVLRTPLIHYRCPLWASIFCYPLRNCEEISWFSQCTLTINYTSFCT